MDSTETRLGLCATRDPLSQGQPCGVPTAAPDVTVSVINHDSGRVLENCLQSLFAQVGDELRMEVYVIDNASTDGNREMLREKYPSVKVICNTKREGFGANHNKALARGAGRYFLVLNDDTLIHGRAVQELVAYADRHPEAGIVGPRILNADGTLQDSCVHFPALWRELRCTALQRFGGYPVDAYPPEAHEVEGEVDWLRGPCLLVRREALARVGALDERFFLFYEETDWCYRMRQNGWRNLFCPAARITHFGKQSVSRTGTAGLAMGAQITLSSLLYYDKHHAGLHALGYRTFLFLYTLLRLAKATVPLGGAPADRAFARRLCRHLLWLTTRRPGRLVQLGSVLGGLPSRTGAPAPQQAFRSDPSSPVSVLPRFSESEAVCAPAKGRAVASGTGKVGEVQ